MEFFKVVQERHSIRSFTGQPVEPEKLEAILQTANQAPSAGNLQAYEIFRITRPKVQQMLARAALDQEFILQAPVTLVFCANPDRSAPRYSQRGRSLYCIQDATVACAYAQLAATALGLASVWVGAFNEEAVREAVGAGSKLLPVAILPVGYAAERPAMTSRRDLKNLVHDIA